MRSFIKFIDQKGYSIIILVLSDATWYFLSFIAAYKIRNSIGVSIQPIQEYLRAIPFGFLLLVLVFYLNGLYQKKQRINQFSEIFLISKSVTFTLILIMAASFMEKYDYSRALVIIFYFLSLILLNFGRFLIRLVKNKLIKKGYGIMRVLIIGAGKAGKNLAQNLEKYYNFGYRITGFIDDYTNNTGIYPHLGKTDQLKEIIKKYHINEVYISDPAMSHDKILSLIHDCEKLPIRFKVVSDLFEIVAGSIDVAEIEGIPAIDLQTKNKAPIYNFFKRLIDLVISILGILILLPLWMVLFFFIKLESKGPGLFKQQRVGKDSQLFTLYKLRTMDYHSADQEFAPHNLQDKRITKVGKFLRRTSLDETPQLINVLKGEMSIVGPRPEMPFIVEKYKPWQKKRLEVKPGITGLWQILGRKDLPLLDNLQFDFYYIKNQSLLLDLVIIVKTILALITRRGAY